MFAGAGAVPVGSFLIGKVHATADDKQYKKVSEVSFKQYEVRWSIKIAENGKNRKTKNSW